MWYQTHAYSYPVRRIWGKALLNFLFQLEGSKVVSPLHINNKSSMIHSCEVLLEKILETQLIFYIVSIDIDLLYEVLGGQVQ